MKKRRPAASFMPAIRENWIAGFLFGDSSRLKSPSYTTRKQNQVLIEPGSAFAVIVCALIFQLAVLPAYAQSAASTSFAIEAATFANGGGITSSSMNFITISIIGQGLVPLGHPASTSFSLEIGQPDLLSSLRREDELTRWKITEITARTEVLGMLIPPSAWQRDNDPYIYWGILVEPPSLIKGFSIAVDAMPDLEPETTSDFYQFPDDALGSGQHLIYVLPLVVEGLIGEEESVRTFPIWVDTAPPYINQFTPGSGALINDNKMAISCHVSDPESGIDQGALMMSLNGVSLSAVYDEESQTLQSASELFLAEGKNTVFVTVYDVAGNYVNQAWEFVADAQPPTGTMNINGGAEVTYSAYVSLNLEAADAVSGVTTVFISNDGVFDTELNQGYAYQPIIKNWLVAQPDTDGAKKVFVKFQDAAGNISATYSDEITMRRMTPQTRIISGPDAVTDDTDARFTFEATKPNSVFSVSLDGGAWTNWSTSRQAAYTGLSEGNHYFFVKSAFDLNADGQITVDEEDSTPAQWVWTIGEAGIEELIEEKILYWKR